MRKKGIISVALSLGAIIVGSITIDSKEREDLKTIDRQGYEIVVDENGVMRRSDNGEEVAYFGVNYTLPFAHAYRGAGYLGLDRKEIIDRDVYHFDRLGLNAYRVHLWESELADSAGNLLSNDHLDLLDYLISKLEERGIDIILTAQTSFGNGYPERNIDTGSFAYDYNKCEIHEDPSAQNIQENYLTQFVGHVNPYTGKSIADDKGIIALEINNEPCHSGTKEQVTAYINRMKDAIRRAGFDRLVLYNVTHNPQVTEAYYDADIQGTTYQWYPDGLVSGHERKGNLLPYVDDYPIPWDTIPNFSKMAKVVYEFDPGDVLASYLYPAIARTFKGAGFQWATQFAYDPTPLAPFNTEYQTHYLNLLYTPSKALSMAVAAEVMKDIPLYHHLGVYPENLEFGNFRVSYDENLSEYNTPETFIYTNSTSTEPEDAASLTRIAGVGSSKVVEYTGNGAYFIDRLPDGLWRLEVLPDVAVIEDPFETPSLKREAVRLYDKENDITLRLPSLGDNFYYRQIAGENMAEGHTATGTFPVRPGVYLLGKEGSAVNRAALEADETLKVFAARPLTNENLYGKGNRVFVKNLTPPNVAKGEPLTLETEIFSDLPVDSVKVYTSRVSFWRDKNPIYNMEKNGKRGYKVILPTPGRRDESVEYNVVVFTPEGSVTYPGNISGTPLDWDFRRGDYYSVNLVEENEPIILMRPEERDPHLDISVIPDNWRFRAGFDNRTPGRLPSYKITLPSENSDTVVIRRFVADELSGNPNLAKAENLNIMIEGDTPENVAVGLLGSDGVTYLSSLSGSYLFPGEKGRYRVPLSRFVQDRTLVVPAPFPVMLPRSTPDFLPQKFIPAEVESVEVRIYPAETVGEQTYHIGDIWLE